MHGHTRCEPQSFVGGGVLDPARLGSLSKFCSSVLEYEESDSLPVRFGERVLFLFEEGDPPNRQWVVGARSTGTLH